MRAALMARVWNDPDLRRRVTILPTDTLLAPLPARIAGAVLSASLMHLSPDERRRLWTMLSHRLAPGGKINVELQARTAIDIHVTVIALVQVGRMTYTGTAQATALPGERQRWTMAY